MFLSYHIMIRLVKESGTPFFYKARVLADNGTFEDSACLSQLGYISFNIIPRDFDILESDVFLLNIVEEGTKISQLGLTVIPFENGNFINVSFIPTILKDEHYYSLEFTKNGNLWFRDKLFITSQTNKTINYTLNTNAYQEHTSINTEYTIL